jgi:hypothetical protein
MLLVQTQGRNIRTYAGYLVQRAVYYGTTKVDFVRSGEGRFKTLSVDKGLLRETESVQDQIRALLKCDVSIAALQIFGMPANWVAVVLVSRTGERDYSDSVSSADYGPACTLPCHERRHHQCPR